MRTLLALVAIAAALAIAPLASGGGWASVGFEPLPDGTSAGSTWRPTIFVKQHGVSPLAGLQPVVEIYDDTGLTAAQEEALRLFHGEGALWVDRTTSRDTAGNVVCGEVTSLSPFVLLEDRRGATGRIKGGRVRQDPVPVSMARACPRRSPVIRGRRRAHAMLDQLSGSSICPAARIMDIVMACPEGVT